MSPDAPISASVDPAEIERFSAMAAEWWDPEGKFKPLHALDPVRLAFIRDRAADHFGLGKPRAGLLKGLKVLDIGCGGGLLCEPMARLGASVTGVDPSERNIAIARVHAGEQGLAIDYRVSTAEAMAADGKTFDIVLNMEVLEHVTGMSDFLAACAGLMKPDGLMFCATLNRTFKSFALAIIGAEYILRWLPAGTHQWEKFITPNELRAALEAQGLRTNHLTGIVYNPFSGIWSASADVDVNYMLVASRRS